MQKTRSSKRRVLSFVWAAVVTGFLGVQTAFAAHEAAHGGALVGLESGGTEIAHIEWTLDPSEGVLTAYLTDAAAEMPLSTPQEAIELTLYFEGDPAPVPLTLAARSGSGADGTSGEASEFTGRSDRLKGVAAFKATLASLFVAGQEVLDVSFGYPEGSH